MPIVLLEALGYGTSVLASDIAPSREVLGSFGRTFKAGSVEDLLAKLAECFGVADGVKDGVKDEAWEVQALARRDFDWDAVTSRWLEVYEALEVARH
jgi:glycosyltransferase involved in cell wall biosynthesis